MKLKRKCQRGVTLMELVVTVIVVSILAGAGIPMYLCLLYTSDAADE